MTSPDSESIASRSSKLNQLILRKQNDLIPNSYLASRDSLLDALFALYDECSQDYMRNDHNISLFVDKFRHTVSELKRLQVNKADFEIKKVIGRGHFGEVQVVREKVTGNIHAMKILKKKETLSQRNVAFYEEERDIMAKATSPWLTHLHYAFQDTMNLYLVMEFHPGGDMLSLLSHYDDRFSEDMARFYLAELVLAIHSLHTMNYVHRDIKPDNILIDRTGHIKLADFGSAALLNSDKTVSSIMPVGTPDYIAPEVLMAMEGIHSSKNRYGVECDWWSLGIVGYEMLFGATPFTEDTVLLTYNKIMNFKETLSFPEEEASEEAISLIRDLIKEAPRRMRYEQLLQHPFFACVDWDSIRQEVPPFMPVVSGQDDTSNFDELEHEAGHKRGNMDYEKKGFSGKNLPFVGFTYTSGVTSSGDANTTQELLLSPQHPCANATQNNEKEVVELKDKLKAINKTNVSMQQRISSIQAQLKEKSETCASLLEEKKILNKNISSLKRELLNSKKMFIMQKKQMEESEKKTMSLVKDLRAKYKNKEEELKAELTLKASMVSSLENEIKALQEDRSMVEDKLHHLEKEKEEIDGKIHSIHTELCKQTTDAKERIDKMQTEHHREVEALKTIHKHVLDTMSHEFNASMAEKMNEIESLKKKLAEQKEELKKLHRGEVEEMKGTLEQQCRSVAELEKKLAENTREYQNLIQMKDAEVTETKKQLTEIQNSREESAKLLKKLNSQLTDVTSENEKLLKDLQNMQKKEIEQAELIKDMQNRIEQQEEIVKKLESLIEDHEAKKYLGEQQEDTGRAAALGEMDRDAFQQGDQQEVKQLVSEVGRLKERLTMRILKIQDLEANLRQKDSEISNMRIDLRIARRETKQAEEAAEMLKNVNHELQEKMKDAEKHVSDTKDKQNCMMAQLKELEEQFLAECNKLKDEKKSLKDERNTLKDKITLLESANLELDELRKREAEWKEQCEESNRLCETLKTEIASLKADKASYNDKIAALTADLQIKDERYRKLEHNFNILRTASSEMDQQLNEYVAQVNKLREEKMEIKEELESSKRITKKLEEKLKDAMSRLAQEREKITRMERESQEAKEETDAQITLLQSQLRSLEDQVEQQHLLINELTDRNGELEDCLSSKIGIVSKFEAETSNFKDEILLLKEESGRYLTQLLSVKSSNRKLCQALEGSMEKNKELEKQVEILQNTMECAKEVNESEKIKTQQTIAQQSKLIDFLQMKVGDLEKKKKPMQWIFGSKSKEPMTLGIPMHFKELQELLEKEKAKNRRLQEKLDRTKTEVMACHAELHKMSSRGSLSSSGSDSKYPASKAPSSTFYDRDEVVSTWDVPTPSNPNGVLRKDSGAQRMKHNIPHRFHETLCMRSTKCSACLDSIHFGRYASKCLECNTVCHTKCSQSLGNSCGLPSAYLQHFSDCVGRSCDETDGPQLTLPSPPQHDTNVVIEGWLKMLRPGKNIWDRRFARIQGTKFQLFKTESAKQTPTSSLCFEMELRCPNGEIFISSAVPSVELLEVSKTDLPYVLKVESRSQPNRSLYIMAATFEEKKMWVAALESTMNKFSEESASTDTKLLDETRIVELNGSSKLDVNCAYLLSEKVLLLGAREGLFMVVNPLTITATGQPQRIEGVSSVHQLDVVESADLVVLIEGRKLQTAKYSALLQQSSLVSSGSKSTQLQLCPVDNVQECHLFSLSQNNSHNTTFIFAACEKEICLFSWNFKERCFLLNKRSQTCQPCSCVHFTQEIAIFGSDKFYELDLKYYTIEEFLDPTDSNLAFYVYGAEQNQVLPIGVFPVFQQEEEEEYVLCFNNSGVFVDGNGRYTSGYLKWTGLPLSFVYDAKNLLVLHNDLLEILPLLPKENLQSKTPSTVLKLAKPRYLGKSSLSGGIFLASIQDTQVSIYHMTNNIVDELLASGSATSQDNHSEKDQSDSDDSRFSFTSSVVNILELSS